MFIIASSPVDWFHMKSAEYALCCGHLIQYVRTSPLRLGVKFISGMVLIIGKRLVIISIAIHRAINKVLYSLASLIVFQGIHTIYIYIYIYISI